MTILMIVLLVLFVVFLAAIGVCYAQFRKSVHELREVEEERREAAASLGAAAVAQQLQNEDAVRYNALLERRLSDLPLGSRHKYRLSDGSDVWIRISSERLRHENGAWGWEAVFEDDGQIGFADERRIIAASELAS